MPRRFLLLAAFVAGLFSTLGATAARADVKLPALFTDNMVLQRDRALPVWGWADPGEQVTVQIAGQSQTAKARADGKWTLRLEALAAGGPHELAVSGNNTIRVKNVLVGEVWLCSGQSNMAMTVARSANAEQEITSADHPSIRMFTVARRASVEPVEDVAGAWAVCSPQTAGGFSATAYYFGLKLYQELNVPIGLINSSWGGTPVEAWTSRKAQQAVPAIEPLLTMWKQNIAAYDEEKAQANYAKALERWKKAAAQARAAGKQPPRRPRAPVAPATSPHRPANLYNGMIAPLVPYALRGAIWYQGEHNAVRNFPHLYATQLPTMIRDWRHAWGQGQFPFLFVQLPNFRQKQTQPVETSGWVIVQEGMLKTLATPNTGMAITIDVGEAGDIHPKNKQDVGLRLALWALGTTYDRKLTYAGPIYKSMRREGDKIVLEFAHTGGGLSGRDGKPLRGFAIAGKDRKFVRAEARVVGDTVEVSSPDVNEPAAVRYAWASNPDCNLVNGAGLPASPFRTDDWELSQK